MTINHHPDDATLLSYAAGSLCESFEILVACHMQQCPQCRQRVSEAECVGAALLEDIEPVVPAGRDRMLAFLDSEARLDRDALLKREDSPATLQTPQPVFTDGLSRCHQVPEPLDALLHGDDGAVAWRRLVPGIQQVRLPTADQGLRLLKIAPGISIPLHTHKGSELTLILQGSYSDEVGRFQPGDVADLDVDVEHQPITDGRQPCICLIATDAPLVFHGLLPKLLQPFTGL